MRIDILKNARPFFLADGGLETFMIFDQGFDLPGFASWVLLETDNGRAALAAYFDRYIALARETGRGFVMDTPTWRAGQAWAELLERSPDALIDINRRAVAFTTAIRTEYETASLPIVVNGVVGPAGDGYAADTMLSAQDAFAVHAPQVRALAQAGVDMISAVTMTHAGEATGIALAAREIGIAVVISFTVETDGRLPSGQSIGEAIVEVDDAAGAAPIFYMINCAHPDHFREGVRTSEPWAQRIGGIRANASRMSHAELDAAEELDDGDPVELAHLHQELLELLPNIRVVGGCCGTDHRHVGCIASHATRLSAA
ncbi:MAG: homocysteine S-methyltransferase family protein [Roseitalea sp.]|jgi:homocysteine S-methyltransferase|nr:homocysteine S-methyltransferase family protein [Roseitalea sp.]MBO6721084.1 homocysteine S-methyltransferase family protein [Roseitalea sp.]MBO6742844.1 homocysteine S-methyltransferase family protein [Roseitalea sp.]